MALASTGSLGPVLVYLLGAPRAPHADPGLGWVLSSVSPGGGADAGEVVLAADSTRESRDFLGTIVAEIQVYTKRAIICYTVPMPDDSHTPGADSEEVLLGGQLRPLRIVPSSSRRETRGRTSLQGRLGSITRQLLLKLENHPSRSA